MPSHRPLPPPVKENPRALALNALLETTGSPEAPDSLLEHHLSKSNLDARDKGLAVELTYGVLRRMATLDWRLAPLLDRPLARLPILVQMILRLGAYQLLFLDRIPPSAAVNESVNSAKQQIHRLKRDWGGFVNAVLRRLVRDPTPEWPSIDLDPVKHLSVKHSMPDWLSRRWVDRYGTSVADRLCAQASGTPPVTLRVHKLRSSREDLLSRLHQDGISATPTAVSPYGIRVDGGGPVPSLSGFEEGAFYVEDEAAQLIPLLMNPSPGSVVLDACAAPGGKSIHLADLMQDRGMVYAVDRSDERLSLLRENCRRMGVTIVKPISGDVRSPAGLSTAARSFDSILVDAPCSGLGVLRRHPEAKWRKVEADLLRHHNVQLEILGAVASRLRPGGVLVYSTCSGEPEETTSVVDDFLSAHAGFRRESAGTWLPASAQPFLTEQGDLSTVDNEFSMDGFFAARLRKQE